MRESTHSILIHIAFLNLPNYIQCMQKQVTMIVRPVMFAALLMVASLLLCAADTAHADGCYFPESAVRKIPSIPSQRVILSWQDGVETLVISSALNSEAQALGWIIPLPSVPDRMEKTSPGMLKTLNFCIQPRITHDLTSKLGAAIFLSFIANLLLATILFKRHRFGELLLLLLLFGLLAGMMLPAFGTARGGSPSSLGTVSVEKTAKVGAYEIAVLRSKTADDLNAWLTDNGFTSMPAEASAIVADYIKQNWVFAAIKLTREDRGVNSPHPVRLDFKSQQPVYPLKLTSIAGGSTAFEIYVVGKDKASTELLKVEFCDKFTKIESIQGKYDDHESGETCSGTATKTEIGHPGVAALMWNNAVLTKFTGNVDAEKMIADIVFDWVPFKAYQHHLYTQQGAVTSAWILFICALGAFFFVSMIACHKKLSQQEKFPWYFGRVFFPLTCIAGVMAFVFYITVPKLPPAEIKVSRKIRSYHHNRQQFALITMLMTENPELLKKSTSEISEFIIQNASLQRHKSENKDRVTEALNPISGDKLQASDTPGDFTIQKEGTNIILRVYDHTGRPLRVDIPIPTD